MIYKKLLTFLCIAFTLSYCSVTEQVTRTQPEERDPADSAATIGMVGQIDLDRYRSKLKDLFTTQNHDIPEAFLKSYRGDDEIERDPYDGFRIQILSTRTVALADSAAKRFRVWADTSITGYIAQTYVTFKQPYYKVHTGDFHDRERAIHFSKLVKRQFPDAWVVHDRINPYLVPADTVEISFVDRN